MGWSSAVILICWLASSRVLAYPTPMDLDGQVHRWPLTVGQTDVYFDISVTDESLRTLFYEITLSAADVWSGVDNTIIRVKPATIDVTSQITIYFESSIAGGDMAAGYSIFDDIKDGVPQHCSVHIAADSNSDSYNLSKTTLHEMGHCLGLGHSLVPSSIMSYSLEKNSFGLAMDDEAAIARLYPADGSRAKLAPGCAVGSRRQSGGQPFVIFILFIVPVCLVGLSKIMRRLLKN